MTGLRQNKIVFLVLALFLLVSLFLAFVHQHADGRDFDHCFVCKFVRQIASLFILAVTVFFSSRRPEFVVQDSVRSHSFFTSSKLRNRAPPILS